VTLDPFIDSPGQIYSPTDLLILSIDQTASPLAPAAPFLLPSPGASLFHRTPPHCQCCTQGGALKRYWLFDFPPPSWSAPPKGLHSRSFFSRALYSLPSCFLFLEAGRCQEQFSFFFVPSPSAGFLSVFAHDPPSPSLWTRVRKLGFRFRHLSDTFEVFSCDPADRQLLLPLTNCQTFFSPIYSKFGW